MVLNCTYLHELYRLISNCVIPDMVSLPNPGLNDALDSQEQTGTLLPGRQHAALDSEDQQAAGSHDYYEEHMARLTAEGEAVDYSRRLTVAQEQLAEYAAQKEEDAAGYLQQAQSLEKLLTSWLESNDNSPARVQAASRDLCQKLAEEAGEAKSFAAQQKADVERAKRTSSQADLAPMQDEEDVKRPREENGHANGHAQEASIAMSQEEEEDDDSQPTASTSGSNNFLDRAKYIPLRLQLEERRLLRLLEAALSVSEYTDKVDVLSWKSKTSRIHTQIKDICAILCGLVVAQDYKKGQQLVRDRNFQDNAEFFQNCFEAGRRFKIMNPDKMRSEYGKLVYLLMDSSDDHVQNLLEFKCVRPLRTVYTLLEECNGLAVLQDPLVEAATAEIVAGGRPRPEIQRDIRRKEKAREALVQRYSSNRLPEKDLLQCLYSISDNNSFLLFNRDPVDRMIAYLQHYFQPNQVEQGFSLGISGGLEGARLTHNHQRQYNYALQSLTLWREISHDMFKLWCLAETDLLSESNSYRLTNTGQGLNRVQQAPGVSRAMHNILYKCQKQIGHWVGSSVIHLGDHNVPNALMFIDKYTQVPRILNPVVLVVDALPDLCKDTQVRAYVDSAFGSVEQCRKSILADFFKHAFDGGGADNFFDAGSCIDGRLTSAWNWSSKIEKKPYYNIFKMAGFVGFDGRF